MTIYKVEEERLGCQSCGEGRLLMVVGPDGVGVGGRMFADRGDADDLAELLNRAYIAGYGDREGANVLGLIDMYQDDLASMTTKLIERSEQPPDVFFWVKLDQSGMYARPPGARISIHSQDDGTSSVRIYSGERRLAYVCVVEAWSEEDRTNEAMMIACALYWSHWRHLVQSGERPAEELDQRQNPCADTYHPTPFWKTSRVPEVEEVTDV